VSPLPAPSPALQLARVPGLGADHRGRRDRRRDLLRLPHLRASSVRFKPRRRASVRRLKRGLTL